MSTATTEQQPQTASVPAKVPVRMGLAPTSFDEGYRMAQLMASSELVPKNFRQKPADVLVAIELGIELGLAPMQALQSIAVINGRPSVWGDGFLALIMNAASYQDHDEYFEVDGKRVDGLTVEDLKKDATCAVCSFWRRNKATIVTRRFTVGQAKKASLWGKEGPWQQYPDRMLAMRARSFAGRDAFPDVLRGLTTAEEAADLPPVEVVPVPVREVRRISETAPVVGAATLASNFGAAPAEQPAADTKQHNGVKVVGVKVFDKPGEDWYAVVELSNGTAVETSSKTAAGELGKFSGTSHLLNVSANGLELVDFGIAD